MVLYQSATSISWRKKASTPLAALLSWGQDSATMKKAARTRRKWMMTIQLWRWYPRAVSPTTSPQVKNFNPSKFSNADNTGLCCGQRGHIRDQCYKRDQAECIYCKVKGLWAQACKKKAEESQAESLASSLRSANKNSEATDQDLVKDSSSTDHVIVKTSWFTREVDTKISNSDGGSTKVLGIREVEILAKKTQGKLMPLVLKEALFSPGYRTNLVSVSNIVDKGHKIVHDKRKSLLCLKIKDTIPIERKEKLFFLRTSPQHDFHVANLSGGPSRSELWHKRLGHLNSRDLKNSVPIESKDENAKPVS